MPDQSKFDPRQHLIQLKGKLYLETKYRIQWFRQDHPRGCISTEIVNYDPMMIKATVFDGEGNVLATAHAGAVDKGNAVWSGRALEKSETAAIGRALAHAGYGTQFAGTEEHDTRRSTEPNPQRQTSTTPTPPARQPARTTEPPAVAKSEDLREKDVATSFINHWRGQGLTDAQVLSALGVAKLSDWAKGVKAANQTVQASRNQAQPA